MHRHLLKSEKGVSLVEVLTTLVIIGIFSILILNYLVSGVSNFNKVNDKISLQDEANFVMQSFINHIYDATKVEVVEQNAGNSLIRVRNYEGEVTTLGFKNNKAVINGTPIHADKYKFLNGSVLKLTGEKSVAITIIIEEKASGQSLRLENSVSYLKAGGGEQDET